ncbi:hypothetical protein [Halalkalibacter flavus]|uniref:hypothetical protein n=1 Tax=Halalkalibacter flavus TaxID=3090668 RepID=UPI002FCBE16D
MIDGIKKVSVDSKGLVRSLCLLGQALCAMVFVLAEWGHSATNPNDQIHRIQGLFVADNNIIPTSGAANNSETTVVLVIRTADE